MAPLLEAVDDVARLECFHPVDLRVDAGGDLVQLVQRRAGLGVDGDALRDLGDVDRALERSRQAVLEQHLAVRDVDVGEAVRRGAGFVQDANDREGVVDEIGLGVGRLDWQIDRVADILLELFGDGLAQNDLALRTRVDRVALRVGQADGAPTELGGIGRLDLVAGAKSEVQLSGLGRKAVSGKCRGHALDVLDLVDLRDRDERRGRSVGRTDLHARAEIGDAAIDQGVEVLRQRAHRGQREHADGDARDGEEAAELVARDVADGFHGGCSDYGAWD